MVHHQDRFTTYAAAARERPVILLAVHAVPRRGTLMGRDTIERIHRCEVLPRSQRHGLRPFATIGTTLLASARVRELSATDLRVWLWCEASWTPKHNCVASVRHIGGDIGKEPSSVGAALRNLVSTGLLVLAKAARRPGAMGSDTRGAAAVYDLPDRHKGARIERRSGDKSLAGAWKVYSEDLRRLASSRTLGDAALRTLIAAVLPHPRFRDGTLQVDINLDLSPDALNALMPDVPRATMARGVPELKAAGLVAEVQPAAGRRSAVYAPSGVAIQRIPRGRAKTKLTQPEVQGHGEYKGAVKRDAKAMSTRGIWLVPVILPPAAHARGIVASQMAARKTLVASQMEPQETTTGIAMKPVIEGVAA